jgi:two-component system, OmpR family, copper resistance phosphate regulon response regulator CusR
MKILLIEDEPEIAAVIKQGLEAGSAPGPGRPDAAGANGGGRAPGRYEVDVVEDGAAGLDRALRGSYSLIILDLMLPGLDGWQICQRLRARKNPVPILMLTARDAVDDRVRGLEMGADDYLPKPFAFKELRARVHALLRRDKIHKGKTLRIADLEIDTDLQRVTRAGQAVPLTQREYLLLEALATREGHVLTREMIQERVWRDDESYSNTVDVHISSLRKKIDVDHEVKLIHTAHGRGYLLRGPDSEEVE